MEWLRSELEIPLIANETLSESFLGNLEVEGDALADGRVEDGGGMKLTILEDLLSRYKVRMHTTVNYGLDDNHPIGTINYIKKENLGVVSSWKILSDEPIEDMMDYVFDKGYFGIFSRGVMVNEDGSFQLHNLISKNLGKTGIFHEQI